MLLRWNILASVLLTWSILAMSSGICTIASQMGHASHEQNSHVLSQKSASCAETGGGLVQNAHPSSHNVLPCCLSSTQGEGVLQAENFLRFTPEKHAFVPLSSSGILTPSFRVLAYSPVKIIAPPLVQKARTQVFLI